MICKDSTMDLQQQKQQQQQQMNGYSTVQHRHKKSQLITFSSSSHDLKYATTGGRNSIISTASSNGHQTRFSFAEEDIMTINQHNAANTELEDEVFRRHSLEADQGVEGDADMDEELFDDELIYCGTHISASLNANDDSGGGSGSYEDSHALHSSIGGSNRNSLEKDDDDVDVISTDVSCYDQLVGSAGANVSLILGHDEDTATLRGDHNETPTANYAKIKITLNGNKDGGGNVNGVGVGGFTTNIIKGGDCAGSLYANPFMDDEGIAESGM